MQKFKQIFLDLNTTDISRLLKELKEADKIMITGNRRWATWSLKIV